MINPFYGIIETDTSPNARTLRTGLWQKIKDAFFVFAGDFDLSDPERRHTALHVGLFDYFTLFLFFIVHFFFLGFIRKEINPKNPVLNVILGIFLIPLSIPLILGKYAAAAALTLTSLPVIMVVHIISLIFAHKLKERILVLPVVVDVVPAPRSGDGHAACTVEKSTEKKIFSSHLQKNDIDMEDVAILDVTLSDSENKMSQELTLNFYRKPPPMTLVDKSYTKKIDFSYRAVFDSSVSSEKTRKDIRALIALNVGGVTAKLEENPQINDQINNWIFHVAN